MTTHLGGEICQGSSLNNVDGELVVGVDSGETSGDWRIGGSDGVKALLAAVIKP